MRQDAHEQLHGLAQPHLVRQNPALDVRRRGKRDPGDLPGVPVHEARSAGGSFLREYSRVPKRRPQRMQRRVSFRFVRHESRDRSGRLARRVRAPLLPAYHPVHRPPLVRPRIRQKPRERAGERRRLPRRLRRRVRRARRRVARNVSVFGFGSRFVRFRVSRDPAGDPAGARLAGARRDARGEAFDRVRRRTQPVCQDASQSRVLLLAARVFGERRRVRERVGGEADAQTVLFRVGGCFFLFFLRMLVSESRRRAHESQRAFSQQRQETLQERLSGGVGVAERERLRRKRVASPARSRRRFDAKRVVVVVVHLGSRLGGDGRGSTHPRPLERRVVPRGGPHERTRARRPERNVVRFWGTDGHTLERGQDDVLRLSFADGHFHGFGERRVPSPRTAFFTRRGRRCRLDADALVPTRRGFPPRHRGPLGPPSGAPSTDAPRQRTGSEQGND